MSIEFYLYAFWFLPSRLTIGHRNQSLVRVDEQNDLIRAATVNSSVEDQTKIIDNTKQRKSMRKS